ncbi:MAG: response regulator [Planctomycetota bacterium]|nr:MAG: response regulator [Planctomycetota bacterium]REK46733.1 MAG: response regulator [Planctomycetota bacterium]
MIVPLRETLQPVDVQGLPDDVQGLTVSRGHDPIECEAREPARGTRVNQRNRPMGLPVAEFAVQTERDVARLASRARLLGSLAGLASKKRDAFGQAVELTARDVLGYTGHASVQFGVSGQDGPQMIEAVLRDRSSGEDNLREFEQNTVREKQNLHTRIATESVDEFQIYADPENRSVIRIAQQLPSDAIPMTEVVVSEWSTALAAGSAASALAASQKQIRELAEKLSEVEGRGLDLERELAEIRSLNETLELLALVASKIDNAVLVADADGSIEWVNDGFVRLTGYDLSEVAGKRLFDILGGPQADPAAAQELQTAIRSGRGLNQEVLQYRKDGKSYWASLSITPVFGEDARTTRWIALAADITKKRQAQDALENAKQSAEAASQAKSDFLANMSHEIRTPMNAIIGMTELALDTNLTNDQREYLGTVKDSAESLMQLLNDILDLSKIEAGRLDIDQVAFSLPQLIQDLTRPLAHRAGQKGVEFTWHVYPDVPELLVGDPVRLRQVMLNLIDNAIRFTAEGGIALSVESQWQTEKAVSLHFRVQDTGIGIATDKLQKIFDAFTQADTSTTRKYGGTGLGLAISSQLVELMGGRIWAQSEVDQGSTFHVTLPFLLAEAEVSGLPDPGELLLAEKRVLIVDDCDADRQFLVDQLELMGMQPTACDSGRAALATIEGNRGSAPFSIVLLDASMPAWNGFDVARRILERSSNHSTIIMLLTPESLERDTARCRELGLSTYLIKPISPNELKDALLLELRPPPASAVEGQEDQQDTRLCINREGEPPGEPRATNDSAAQQSLRPPDGRSETRFETKPRPFRPLKVVVADDHAANRTLASRLLEKRGHVPIEVTSGLEVLSQLKRERVDAILLDVQMPDMDGLETAAAIRKQEEGTGDHVPIIAVTAHAMKGDEEKCRAAGMDGYIAKPLGAQKLYALLESLAAGADCSELNSTATRETVPRVNFETALARLEGDVEILKEQMAYYLEDSPRLMASIRSAMQRRDSRQLAFAAHRLKGLASSFDASAVVMLASQLKHKSDTGDFSGSTVSLSNRLGEELDHVSDAVRQFLAAN